GLGSARLGALHGEPHEESIEGFAERLSPRMVSKDLPRAITLAPEKPREDEPRREELEVVLDVAADDRVIAMERELGFEGCKRYGLEAQIGEKGETISTRLFHGSASAGELPPGDGAARHRRERIARFHLVARSRRIRSVAIVPAVERFARGGIPSRSRSFPCDVGPVESVSRGDAEVERHGLAARCARLALQTSKPLGRKLRHAQPAREPLVELRATKRPRRIEAPCE